MNNRAILLGGIFLLFLGFVVAIYLWLEPLDSNSSRIMVSDAKYELKRKSNLHQQDLSLYRRNQKREVNKPEEVESSSSGTSDSALLMESQKHNKQASSIQPLAIEFGAQQKKQALEVVNWPKLGELLVQRSVLFAESPQEALPQDKQEEWQKVKTGLENEVLLIVEQIFPHYGQFFSSHSPHNQIDGVVGIRSDSLFIANSLAAQLEAQGAPLTSEQKQALEALGEEYLVAWDENQVLYDHETLQLTKLLDELTLKLKFLEGMIDLLSSEQQTHFFPYTNKRRYYSYYAWGWMVVETDIVMASSQQEFLTELKKKLDQDLFYTVEYSDQEVDQVLEDWHRLLEEAILEYHREVSIDYSFVEMLGEYRYIIDLLEIQIQAFESIQKLYPFESELYERIKETSLLYIFF